MNPSNASQSTVTLPSEPARRADDAQGILRAIRPDRTTGQNAVPGPPSHGSAPEVLKPIRRHLRVAHRVLSHACSARVSWPALANAAPRCGARSKRTGKHSRSRALTEAAALRDATKAMLREHGFAEGELSNAWSDHEGFSLDGRVQAVLADAARWRMAREVTSHHW
jgi:hypothetical protein